MAMIFRNHERSNSIVSISNGFGIFSFLYDLSSHCYQAFAGKECCVQLAYKFKLAKFNSIYN